MICATCRGTGKLTGHIIGISQQLPCSTCCGSGIDYCCGGADSQLPADWQERDAIGCYGLAIRTIGERVAAGEPLPPFFQPSKPEVKA